VNVGGGGTVGVSGMIRLVTARQANVEKRSASVQKITILVFGIRKSYPNPVKGI
jgi:hypothetical protein